MFLYEHKRLGTLRDTQHGIEREGLRVTPDGKLSPLSHPLQRIFLNLCWSLLRLLVQQLIRRCRN